PGGAGPIPARIFWPEDPPAGPLPLVVFFHGGGFVIGSSRVYARVTGHLANAAAAVVASIDYRLAPEHPFPAAVEDAAAATRWAAATAADLGADPARLVVAGDSAGGNLAAVTALHARDAGGPPLAGQVLIYPVTDMASVRPSFEAFGEGLFLERETMRWFAEAYIPDANLRSDWRVSPLRAPDHRDLPPAYVLTAGLDPLRDEGEAYAEKLRQAGVAVVHRRWEGLIHGFLNMGGVVPEARAALAEIADWIRDLGA
ncbi:MAG: alpha/beta hydrolase, partial [Alphaproteobacteria bacterium]